MDRYILTILLLAATAKATGYVGCFEQLTGSGAVGQGITAGLAACVNLCKTNPVYNFAYFTLATQDCFCSVTSPEAAQARTGNILACNPTTTNFLAQGLYTTFTRSACTTAVTLDPRDLVSPVTGSFDDLGAMYQFCRFHMSVVYTPSTTTGKYEATCINYPPSYTPMSGFNCGGIDDYFYFSHTADNAVSGMARRHQKPRDNSPCPRGFSACRFSGGANAYECLDTSSELESCGGCRFGRYGAANTTAAGKEYVSLGAASLTPSCTTLPGLHRRNAVCVRGRCRALTCTRGWDLVNGRCVPNSKTSVAH